MIKLNKIIKPTTFLVVLLILGSGYALAKIGNPVEFLKHFGKSNKPPALSTLSNNTNKPLIPPAPNKVENPNPPPKIESPVYAATVLSKPNFGDVETMSSTQSSGRLNFPVELKNVSVKPYITNFAFSDCQYLDTKGNSHQIYLQNADVRFDKAVLPGATANFTIKSERIGIVLQQCSYDSGGNHVCQTIEFSKITSCKAYVTTDGSQASNGWGKYPIVVNFPQ